MTVTAEGECLICATDDAPEDAVVFRDDLWAAEVVPGYEVPGWVFLRARRHAELLTGLDPQELATLGFRARDLVAAMSEATGAPAVYLMGFGENYRHFHMLVTARGEDVPADRRTGEILKLRGERIDRAASLRLVPSLRSAYARIAGSRAAA
jgi:diadenosine tetraphosphate (Ap4A) HIT family hydrolase